MAPIRVLVSGSGFMGREVLAAVTNAADMQPVGVLEKFAQPGSIVLPDGSGSVPLENDPARIVNATSPDVVIDFTNADWTPDVSEAALAAGARLVIGTTGLGDAFIADLARECAERKLGACLAPNFAIGAVLMMHMAKLAAKYFDYAEITEMHQERKLDAPSGTAFATARLMVESRGRPFEHNTPQKLTIAGSRGAEHQGIAIHSMRMPGMVAHQEVIFGGLGQTLKIRHDSTGRESFIPGVLLATREVMTRSELIVGLEGLIDL